MVSVPLPASLARHSTGCSPGRTQATPAWLTSTSHGDGRCTSMLAARTTPATFCAWPAASAPSALATSMPPLPPVGFWSKGPRRVRMLPSSATSVTICPSSSLIVCASSTTSPGLKLTPPRASTTASSAAIAAAAPPRISAAKASAGSLPVARMAYSDTLIARGVHAAPPAVSQYGKRPPVKRVGGLCLTREAKLRLAERIGKPIRKFRPHLVEEPRHQLGGSRRGHLPVTRDQRPGAGMEEGVRQTREGLAAEPSTTLRRVAGREHHQVRIELEPRDLARLQESIVLARGRTTPRRRQRQTGLGAAAQLARQEPMGREIEHVVVSERLAPQV